ncbi:thiolase family protein [Mesobacterium pallidum]|uniref:thiolase family protein n=1 Tax=Mesobacterium pallidum TaxID=2872037 RepID=UPI001EE1F589
MRAVYLHAARRSIVAPRGGALAGLSLHELGAPVVRAVMEDAGIGTADELICANALGAGGNPARLVALAAGLPEQVAGLSIDRQCAGGLDSLLLGQALIASGMAETVIAGGVESYSLRPYRARVQPDGSLVPYDRPPFSPWPGRDPEMDAAAATLAEMQGISRDRQDEWAVISHARALAAREVLTPEIVSIPPVSETHDPFARRLTPKVCARAKVLVGNITAANTAVAADGAAFVVMSARPGPVRMVRAATRGAAPEMPGLAPLAAIRALEVNPDTLTHAEIMEAYAVQAIACVDGAGISPKIVNGRGGALARGHPIGASGAVLAVRLFHDLCRDGGRGLAAIAAAGGIGTAALFQA